MKNRIMTRDDQIAAGILGIGTGVTDAGIQTNLLLVGDGEAPGLTGQSGC